MEFADAAKAFDLDDVYDAYTNALLFKAHTKPHDDHSSTGATSRRRTLVTAPTNAVPTRRAVKLYDEYWLAGSDNIDTYSGVPIRRSVDLKKSTGLVISRTVGQACLNAGGTSLHISIAYLRDTIDSTTSSDVSPLHNAYIAPSEALAKGTFLVAQDGLIYRIRSIYTSIEQFDIAEIDQMDRDVFQSLVFTSTGARNLITDEATTASVATTGLQTDVPKFYVFASEEDSTYRPGDRTVFVSKSAVTPKIASTFTMLGSLWKVVQVVSEADAWAIRARLA